MLARLAIPLAALAVALVAALASVSAAAQASATADPAARTGTSHVLGADISWPQCPKGTGIPSRQGEGKPMPQAGTDFVVVGLTNGPGFYPNPCLAAQVRWVKQHHVHAAAYAMTTYPTADRIRRHGDDGPHSHRYVHGRLFNTGFAEAQFNVATMEKVDLDVPFVWVDVEPYPVAPWSSSRSQNAAVVQGAVRGYEKAGLRVGFYSTQSLWAQVVGGLHYGYPEWRTAGQTSMASALDKCSTYPIQGGRAVIAQWWSLDRDFDVACPGRWTRADRTRFFHRY